LLGLRHRHNFRLNDTTHTIKHTTIKTEILPMAMENVFFSRPAPARHLPAPPPPNGSPVLWVSSPPSKTGNCAPPGMERRFPHGRHRRRPCGFAQSAKPLEGLEEPSAGRELDHGKPPGEDANWRSASSRRLWRTRHGQRRQNPQTIPGAVLRTLTRTSAGMPAAARAILGRVRKFGLDIPPLPAQGRER
jgi:hypothetical protein